MPVPVPGAPAATQDRINKREGVRITVHSLDPPYSTYRTILAGQAANRPPGFGRIHIVQQASVEVQLERSRWSMDYHQ